MAIELPYSNETEKKACYDQIIAGNLVLADEDKLKQIHDDYLVKDKNGVVTNGRLTFDKDTGINTTEPDLTIEERVVLLEAKTAGL